MKDSQLQISMTSELSRRNVTFNLQGVTGTILLGSTGNVDLKVLDDCYLTGGQLMVKNGFFGDVCNMQVVDKDGVFANVQTLDPDGNGMFLPDGATPLLYKYLPSYPVLSQFATNCQIMDQVEKQESFSLNYLAKILTGMYLRVIYKSTNPVTTGVAVQVAANYDLHKCSY